MRFWASRRIRCSSSTSGESTRWGGASGDGGDGGGGTALGRVGDGAGGDGGGGGGGGGGTALDPVGGGAGGDGGGGGGEGGTALDRVGGGAGAGDAISVSVAQPVSVMVSSRTPLVTFTRPASPGA